MRRLRFTRGLVVESDACPAARPSATRRRSGGVGDEPAPSAFNSLLSGIARLTSPCLLGRRGGSRRRYCPRRRSASPRSRARFPWRSAPPAPRGGRSPGFALDIGWRPDRPGPLRSGPRIAKRQSGAGDPAHVSDIVATLGTKPSSDGRPLEPVAWLERSGSPTARAGGVRRQNRIVRLSNVHHQRVLTSRTAGRR